MTDAPGAPGPSSGKKPTGSASKKALDDKKRFEVKKVGWLGISLGYCRPGLTLTTFRSKPWPSGPGT